MTIIALLAIALLHEAVGLAGAHRIARTLLAMVSENVTSIQAANGLKIAVLGQRGLVASCILDGGDRKWLDQLTAKRALFDAWLADAQVSIRTDEERAILRRIEQSYGLYNRKQDEAVALFDRGLRDRPAGVMLNEAPQLYEETRRASEQLIAINMVYLHAAVQRGNEATAQLWWIRLACLALTFGLGGWLMVLLFRRVFEPLRQTADEARRLASDPREHEELAHDDFTALRHWLQALAHLEVGGGDDGGAAGGVVELVGGFGGQEGALFQVLEREAAAGVFYLGLRPARVVGTRRCQIFINGSVPAAGAHWVRTGKPNKSSRTGSAGGDWLRENQ